MRFFVFLPPNTVAPIDRSLIFVLHCALDIPVGVTPCDGLALVVKLFTLAKTDAHFDPRALEIKRKGYQGISLPRNKTRKLHYLAFMKQKLFRAKGVAVENVPLLVWGNMYAKGKHFAPVDLAI